jgi:hypothetical protein
MKKLLFAALAVAAATIAQAQQAQEARRQVGVGVSINPFEAGGLTSGAAAIPTVEVYVPINVAPKLRVEPSLGIFTNDEPSPRTSTRDVTIGVGVFYVQRLAAPFDLYMGGRLKLNFAHHENATSNSGTDVLLAGAFGGEHYFSPHFSLGAEAQLGFRSNSSASGDNTTVFTTGLGFLRFYFL